MINLLTALPETRFYERLKAEGRLRGECGGDSVVDTNINPTMGRKALLDGYGKLLKKLYAPKHYYARLKIFFNDYKPTAKKRFSLAELKAFFRSMWRIGIFSRANWRYDKFLVKTPFVKMKIFPTLIEAVIMGFHYGKVSRLVWKKIAKSDIS
jgi:hypothetical protein